MNAKASRSEISNIVIRDIEGQKELRAVEELQKEVWGIPDLDVVPLTQLVAAQAAGGVLLGAFDGETLVGFAYGFVALEHGQMMHHSHMLAVRDDYRNFDLGRRLKMAQRERVLSQGINFMTWTFDPLQSLNAYFNFSKLGVFSDRYLINFYGEEAASFLHQTGTDRLWVTWDLTGGHFKRKVSETEHEKIFEETLPLVKVGNDELPLSGDLDEGLKGEHAFVEIPANINDLVKRGDGSAGKWRESTRRAFSKAIEKGFLIENFHRMSHDNQKFGVYSLRRGKIENWE